MTIFVKVNQKVRKGTNGRWVATSLTASNKYGFGCVCYGHGKTKKEAIGSLVTNVMSSIKVKHGTAEQPWLRPRKRRRKK